MRNSLTLCLLFIFLSLQGVNIIPLPREYETLLGGEFQLTDKTQVRAESKDLQPIADYLIRTLEKRYGVNLINVKRGKQSIYLMIDPDVATAPEGYFLNIGPKQIVVTGFDEAGVFYGVQSLLQCFHVEASTTPDALLRVVAPIMIADDAPAMSYRAVRLLPSHGQKSVDEMKQLIDHLAYRKINRLHWRLNDASHLIYVSEQYPLLALGSIESKDQPLGTFSANQMRELVDYASSRHVALVPEIEEPQNDSIFRKAYGSLYAADSANLTEGRWCLKKGLFCTNDPTTFNIMKLVVQELQAIFGGELVAIQNETDAPRAYALSTLPQEQMSKLRIYNMLVPNNLLDHSERRALVRTYQENHSIESLAEWQWLLPELQNYDSFTKRFAQQVGVQK